MTETVAFSIAAPPCPQSLLGKVGGYFERQWLRIVLLIFCAVAVRAPSLQGQFIWDDEYLARDNPFIKSPLLILEAFRHYLFPDSFSAHYRPVQNISYFFDYLIWNTDPYGFHLSNVLWHAGSGVLLYLLLQRLLGALGERWFQKNGSQASRTLSTGAFLIALLWVVHPVHSAAVDYISGRADSLAFFFAAGGWLLYLRARTAERALLRRIFYGMAAVSALLALCSRESACIWIMIFLLYLFAFDRRCDLRAKWAVLAACLLLFAAYAGLRQLPRRHAAVAASGESSAPMRAVLMLRALGDYGRLMVFPKNLHMERTVEAPEALLGNEGWRHAIGQEYLSILGLLVATGVAFGAARKGAARPVRVFGAAWFGLAYLPISNLIELNATVAEHWLYLPSVGLLIFIIGCLLECPEKIRKLAVAAACLAVAGLSIRSAIRSSDWVSPETFYRHSLAAGASKIRVALKLGEIYTAKGDYAKAEPLLRKVLELSPDYPFARNSLAYLLFREGKTEEAADIFAGASKSAERTRNDYPRTWVAALNVAHMCYNKHDSAASLATLEKARRDYPGTWELISFEAEVLRQTKGPEAALSLVQDFARENWWHFHASLALAKLYAQKGDIVRAEAASRHASWLDVHDVESLRLLALMHGETKNLEIEGKGQTHLNF